MDHFSLDFLVLETYRCPFDRNPRHATYTNQRSENAPLDHDGLYILLGFKARYRSSQSHLATFLYGLVDLGGYTPNSEMRCKIPCDTWELRCR